MTIKTLLKERLKDFDIELIFGCTQKLIEKILKIIELNVLSTLNNSEHIELCTKIIGKIFQGELKQFFSNFVSR